MSPAEERAKRFSAKLVREQAKKDAWNGYAPKHPNDDNYMQTYNWAIKSTQANGVK